MKFILFSISVILLFIACNNAGKHDTPQTHEDSLLKEVMDGHDFTMGKMSKLSAAQKKAQQALDSINKLPEKSKLLTTGFKTELDSLSEKLKYAEFSMNKWMEEFNYDSATKSTDRSVYLESEKQKINNVKEAMLSALQKADSLFKKID